MTMVNPEGALVDTYQFGTDKSDAAYGVAIGPGGGIYITGLTRGSLDGQPNRGNIDAFVTKFRR